MPLRFHWPRGSDLRVNGMVYHAYGRNGATKLGNNGRDAPADIGATFRARSHCVPTKCSTCLGLQGSVTSSCLRLLCQSYSRALGMCFATATCMAEPVQMQHDRS